MGFPPVHDFCGESHTNLVSLDKEQVELSVFKSPFCGAVDEPCVALKSMAS